MWHCLNVGTYTGTTMNQYPLDISFLYVNCAFELKF